MMSFFHQTKSREHKTQTRKRQTKEQRAKMWRHLELSHMTGHAQQPKSFYSCVLGAQTTVISAPLSQIACYFSWS